MGDAYSAKKESVLCASLLRGFLAGLLDFSFLEFPSSEAINVMTPRTTPLARFHAQTNSTVVNLNNEMVSVSEFERSLLSLLDGTRDTLNLIAAMKATFESRPGSEFEDQAIEQHVQQSLQRFTTSALLLP